MNMTDVQKSLNQQFARELSRGSNRHIVFWYDDEGEFAESIGELELDGVTTIKLYDSNMFEVKLYIEEESDQEKNLLVYSPLPRPENRDNWLTDTIKYSQTFSANVTTIYMLEHGFEVALRSVVEGYKTFFREKERNKKFASYGISDYNEQKIHLGVLSVLCKLPAPNLDNVVRTLLVEMVSGEREIYNNIGKFGNVDALWDLIGKVYGYGFPEQSLEKLAILLLCSHLSHNISRSMPDEWQDFVSENPNCFVFVDNFMRDSKDWDKYNLLAAFVADKLGLADRAANWMIDEIVECDTFEDFDRNIINRINENITQEVGEYEYYRKIINSRRNRRYHRHFKNEYDILFHACTYFELEVRHKDLQCAGALEIFNTYTKDYYKIDSCYRHFVAAYNKQDENENYGKLSDMIEKSYTNWFLKELSMKWCERWDDEERWQLPGITAQQEFCSKYVRRFVDDNERIVVIISDGLRYESAVELNIDLNRKQKGESNLDAMLGVIPSTTSFGMASLLPRKQIDMTAKADLEIQSISTEGTENRGKILKLAKKESVAISFEEVVNFNPQQMSDTFVGMKLIYIYHNAIDARGDKAATETEVFDATEKAFEDLSRLVGKLRNFGAINIIITADHGYIFRRTPLAEHDKTPKQELVGIKGKGSRRYILANENIEKQGTQNFSMDYLTPNNSGIYAIIPRTTNCFKLPGAGSRYVHGGTSLQEVVIPVIRFKSDKNEKRSKEAKKVTLGLTNLSRKITSIVTHLTFYQPELVDDKHLPLRVTAYFEDEGGNRISNENIIIADSTSKTPETRAYKEKFTLKDMAYDKTKNYYLVLKDEEEAVNKTIERIPFIIDLVFGGTIQF